MNKSDIESHEDDKRIQADVEKYQDENKRLRARISLLEEELDVECSAVANYRKMCYDYVHSTSWKITEPLRRISRILQKNKRTSGEDVSLDAEFQDDTDSKGKKYLCELIASSNEKSYEPLVTVGIPIYDRTDILVESIESILHQTYKNIEIIAVCDGSPKETVDIVKDYENRGLLRAFYYSDNSGTAVRGRNRAIKEAKGEYYAFQDSDDIASADRIELSVNTLNTEKVDVVYGSWRAIVDGSRQGLEIRDGQVVSSPDCDLEMLKEVCVPCQSTVMARIGALRRVGGLKTKFKYREDHELWLRMAYYGYRFKSISRVLTGLRLHDKNLEISMIAEDKIWKNLMLKEYKIIETPKPKIAYVIPGCELSGGISVICEHLNRLERRGFDVMMITEDSQRKIDWFPRQRVPIYGIEEAKKFNIDILVATGWTTAYTADKLRAGKKYYFVQSDESRFVIDKKIIQKVKKTYSMDYTFFTEARWIQKWLKEEFGKKAAYIPNGVDREIVHRVELPEKKKKIRVLLEGAIDIPSKGMEDAFNAVKDLDCEVWCVSSIGVPKPEWKCDVFFGKVSFNQMKYIYSSCDVLLKMSRVEGFFGPPLEMMVCGGTCVVGKVSGYDEYIVDGHNALVVETGDVKGAHDALNRLIKDTELMSRLKKGGEETARNWQWEKSIDELEKLFLEN